MDVPALNERREDIPDLAIHFLGKLYQVYKRPEEGEDDAPTLSRGAQELLARHDYTGNIRELRSILVRVLFFRNGRVITEQDMQRVLGPLGRRGEEAVSEKLTGQVARELFEAIAREETDFWEGVHAPFSDKRISRDVVAAVIEQARTRGAANLPQVAELLRACRQPNGDPEQRRKFYKFKNFLYKTIKIS
jgi:DNA-binding NtrC family response regulator